jgi:hypothetical protein
MPEALVEQRRREDAAPRLIDEVERLQSLRLSLEDVPLEGRAPVLPYVKRSSSSAHLPSSRFAAWSRVVTEGTTSRS